MTGLHPRHRCPECGSLKRRITRTSAAAPVGKRIGFLVPIGCVVGVIGGIAALAGVLPIWLALAFVAEGLLLIGLGRMRWP